MRPGRMRRTQKTKHRHEGMTSGILSWTTAETGPRTLRAEPATCLVGIFTLYEAKGAQILLMRWGKTSNEFSFSNYPELGTH